MDTKMLDIIMYVVSISEAGYTYAKKQYPFDDPSVDQHEVAAITWCQIAAFIKIKDVTIEQAHNMFLTMMEKDGWSYGSKIDYKAKRHPDMVPFAKIKKDTFTHYSLLGDIVSSAKEFAQSVCPEQSKAAKYVSFGDNYCTQTM